MTALERLYPGDVAVALAFCAALQVAGLVVLGWLLARGFARRHPAAEHAIWRLVLFGVLVAPVVALVVQRAGLGWIELAWLVPSPPPLPGGDSAAAHGEPSGPLCLDRAAATSAADDWDVAGLWPAAETFAPTAPPNRPGRGDHSAEAAITARWFRAIFGVLVAAWSVGVVALVARLIWGWARLVRVRRRLVPLAGPQWRAARRRAARAMGLTEIPPLAALAGLSGPIGFGLSRPVIVLPEDLARCLDDRQLHDILVHETAHFLHRDHVFGLLQRLAEIVYWPHPMVYWLGAELDRAREDVCDNHVLASGRPARYARTLLELSRRPCRPRALFSAIGFTSTSGRLERRVARFFDVRRRHATRVPRATLVLLGAAVSIAAVSAGGVRLVARQGIDRATGEAASESVASPLEGTTGTNPAARQTSAELAAASPRHPARGAVEPTPLVASGARNLDDPAGWTAADPTPEMRIDAADGQFRVRLRAEGLGEPALWISPGAAAELRFGRDASDGRQETVFALRIALEIPSGETESVVANYQLDRASGPQRQRWEARAARWPLGRWNAMPSAVATEPATGHDPSLQGDSARRAAFAGDAATNVAPAAGSASASSRMLLAAASESSASPESRDAGAPVSGQPSASAGAIPVIPGFWLLRLEAVQQEIELTALQRQRLWELGQSLAEAAARDRAAFDEITDEALRAERQREIRRLEKARNEHAQAEVLRLLGPEQLVRLGEIEFRMKAPASLADPRVLDELGADAAQRRRLTEIRRRMEDGLRRLQREAFEQDLTVLSTEQLARLKAIYFPDPTGTSPRPAVTADAAGAIQAAVPQPRTIPVP